MKKNIWKPIGIIALVAVIGFGLVGCANDTPEEKEGNPTIKLAKASENTFTLTLSGTTWKTIDEPKFLYWGNFTASENWIETGISIWLEDFERTSDTVVTVTVLTTGDIYTEAGTGTISLRARDGETAQLYGTAGPLFNALVVGDIELDVASDSGTAEYTITL
jgi:hypothetical protein